MQVPGLKQAPLSTTVMACIQGAATLFGHERSTAMLFGLSGHAFLVNIHPGDLCPSAPYVWKKSRFRELLSGLGIDTVAEYQVTRDTPPPVRRTVEDELKSHLEAGHACVLDYLEHQLISGFDDGGLTLLLPWEGHAPTEVARVAFGTWDPCLANEGWAHLTVMAPGSALALRETLRRALEHALELTRHPSAVEAEGYRVGPRAYEAWMDGVRRGMGSSHGHWWNGMVWSECRQQAAAFFRELAGQLPGPDAETARGELERLYGTAATALTAASEKELDVAEQLRLLAQARDAEAAAVPALEALAAAL